VRTVVISVGTDHHPFDRVLEWAARAQQQLGVHVVAQRGATAPHCGVESFEYIPAPELEARMRAADAVVCHGGPGTIGLCRSAGQRPIVIPRDPSLGEHVDDHQIRWTAKLARQGEIDLVDSYDELIDQLQVEHRRIPDNTVDVEQSIKAFGTLADALLAGELPRRPFRQRLVFRRTL